MPEFKIDEAVCIACGECVRDCPMRIIDQEHGRVPSLNTDKADQCLGCQHCLAVCPTGALSILGLNPVNSSLLAGGFPESKEIELLVKGRRSVRRFSPDALPADLLERLVSLAGHAPSGHNLRPVRFSVVDDPAIMDQVREKTMLKLSEFFQARRIPEKLAFFAALIRVWDERREDVIFRGAPHLVVAHYPKTASSGGDDGIIALSTLDLAASCFGVGTLWGGLLRIAWQDLLPTFKTEIGIPADHRIAGVLLLGKSNVTYQRTVQYDPVEIQRIHLTD